MARTIKEGIKIVLLKSIIAITFYFPLLAFGAVVQMDIVKDTSEVTFLAVGRPSAIKIRGEKGKPEGHLNFSPDGKSDGEFKLDLDQFVTGISMRDHHMKEKYLETQKDGNRFAIIKIMKIDFPADFWSSKKMGEYPFSGKLTLHGMTKEITGKVKIDERKPDSFRGNSNFSIKLTDYGIQIPSFSGITVAESVEIQVNFNAQPSGVK